MRNLSDTILGVPLSKARIRAEAEQFVRSRDVHIMRATMSENLAHLTGKSGALLQAQGIFVVVASYALEQNWPRYLALSSMILLIGSALAVMTNLRTVYIGLDAAMEDSERAEFEIVIQMALLASKRGALFNIALYLTFLSIVLLGVGAVLLEH
jgi:hypothetical protein